LLKGQSHLVGAVVAEPKKFYGPLLAPIAAGTSGALSAVEFALMEIQKGYVTAGVGALGHHSRPPKNDGKNIFTPLLGKSKPIFH
jgi:hypothetical protein